MSLPESMSRIVIVGTKSHMDEAIDALYSVKAIHLIDHTVDADEGFTLGTPRPYSPKASERLLKVRAMEKELGITKHVKADSVPEDEIKSQISSDSVEIVEKEVLSVLDKRNDLNQRITELNATKKNLELLSDIPVDLELYSGYRSIFGVVGTVAEDPTAALSGVEPQLHEAAEIDGAGKLQRMWHISLPSILPTIAIMLILQCGSILSIGYEKVYLMQNTLNQSVSEVISTYVYKIGLIRAQYSYTAAIGLANSVVNVIFLVTVNQIAKKVSEVSLF